MTKLRVNTLIALMAAAMLGIIILQLFWMRNANNVRNELFDRSVKEALIASTSRMENQEDALIIQNIVKHDTTILKAPNAIKFLSLDKRSANVRPDSIHTIITKKLPIERRIENSIQIISSGNDSLERQIQVEFTSLDSVVALLEDKIDQNFTIRIDSALQEAELESTYDKQIFHIEHRTQRLKDVAEQMVFETWVMDKLRLPDTALISEILQKELQERNIPINYELGILLSDGSLIKDDKADSISLVNSEYSAQMYPNELISKADQLLIYFPNRNSFLLGKLIVPAAMSLFFSSLILLIFGLSIFYILKQKKISEMKTDFINNMTHEFKTPLATISVATDSIINPKVISKQESVKYYTDVIKKENQRMNQQVESILQIARLDRKDYDFKYTLVNVHELIEKAIQIISLQVESKGGVIECMFNASNPIITTDTVHALNVLNNLLDNANKYSNGAPEITIQTNNTERGVNIAVTDKGIGMSKAVQQKIFEKFYRETSGNIHNVKGFGLGLSYVKAIIDANNGEVKVKSEPGKGSTFEVFLPFTLSRTD